MPVDWINVEDISFNALLLLEREQLAWFPNWNFPQPELPQALAANPVVAWYLRHKCPEIAAWVDGQVEQAAEYARSRPPLSAETIRQAEVAVLARLGDLITYAVDPAVYDAQPFLSWDSAELIGLVDFSGKTVIDIGAGTGQLALTAAPLAGVVYAVEPVGSLRRYLQAKASRLGLRNVYVVDGLITAIPFADHFADVVMGGHVYGDDPQAELAELLRVTRPGGMVILCPGNNDQDTAAHKTLVEAGFQWSRFEEPQDGFKRKYWMVKEV
jgi:SAM-dependent methyltransferase